MFDPFPGSLVKAYAQPLETLVARTAAFLPRSDLRVLHVVTTPELRGGALDTVMAQEFRPDNTWAFHRLEPSFTLADHGWNERSVELRRQHEARAEAMAAGGETLAALPSAPAVSDLRAAFAGQILQLAEARPPQAEGIIVVLAPAQVEQPKSWSDSVGLLVNNPRLKHVRWILIDSSAKPDDAVPNEESAHVMRTSLLVDDGQRRADLQALATPTGELGAAPSCPPPPRAGEGEPPPLPDETKVRQAYKAKMMAALLALQGGKGAEAVAAQREARDLCMAGGLRAEALTTEIALGGTLTAVGSPDEAQKSFIRAADGAKQAGLPDAESKACFGLGALRMSQGDPPSALVAYAEATVAAEKAGNTALAIEGGRTTGQIAMDMGMETQAIAFFSKAVKLAQAAPLEAPFTSANEAARRLAALCRKRGMPQRAAELEAQAERFESVEVPPPPPEPSVEPMPGPEAVVEAPASVPRPAVPPGMPLHVRPPEEKPPEEKRASPLHVRPFEETPAGPLHVRPPEETPPGPLPVRAPEQTPVGEKPPGPLHVRPAGPDLDAPAAPPVGFDVRAEIERMQAEEAEEGTDVLSVEEIASLHWGGVVPPSALAWSSASSAADDPMEPSMIVPAAWARAAQGEAVEGTRSWTLSELESLHRVTQDVVDEETSAMLSKEEVERLRAKVVLPQLPSSPAPGSKPPTWVPPAAPTGPKPGEFEVDRAEVARILAEMNDEDGDSNSLLRREDLAAMARRAARKKED